MRFKSYSFKVAFFLVGCCSFTISCNKVWDYIHHSGGTDFKECNIKQITLYNQYENGYIDTIPFLFTYNKMGNPLSIIHPRVGTGNPNYLFKYDKYNRLSELVKYYNGYNGYESWERFYYNNKNQVVRDSAYGFGPIVDSVPQPALGFSFITFEYDAEGRITREIDSIYFRGSLTLVIPYMYAYDAKGNLTGASYDDKLSMYRTNNIWMFMTRDYSINNRFTAKQYNEHGLPLDFTDNWNKLLPQPATETKVAYSCH